jgi:lysophospholipase L1-like esterase
VDVDYVRSAYANLAEALLAQCRERGIRTIDFRPLIGPAELSFDGIHLNRCGHTRMAEAVAGCWGTKKD